MRTLLARCHQSLVITSVLLLQACSPVGTLVTTVNHQSDARAVERGNSLRSAHLEMVQRLRDQNDPMGDYLWARANADMMVPDPITDPLIIKKMYEDAATKGSLDAEHVLGLMLITGSSTPSGFCTKCSVLKPDDRNPKLGLDILEKAIRKRCYFWSVEIDGMANRQCLIPVASAIDIWPNFRDGTIFSKDLDQANRWKAMKDSCVSFLKKANFLANPKYPICH